MFKWFRWFLTNKQVQKRYVEAGADFGDAVSHIFMGECIGFEKLLATWEDWEAEYSKRGYRTLPIEDFANFGGWGKPLKDIGVKRTAGEELEFHAKIYRDRYLGKLMPTINLSEMMRPLGPGETAESRIQVGTYILPSTKKSEK